MFVTKELNGSRRAITKMLVTVFCFLFFNYDRPRTKILTKSIRLVERMNFKDLETTPHQATIALFTFIVSPHPHYSAISRRCETNRVESSKLLKTASHSPYYIGTLRRNVYGEKKMFMFEPSAFADYYTTVFHSALCNFTYSQTSLK